MKRSAQAFRPNVPFALVRDIDVFDLPERMRTSIRRGGTCRTAAGYVVLAEAWRLLVVNRAELLGGSVSDYERFFVRSGHIHSAGARHARAITDRCGSAAAWILTAGRLNVGALSAGRCVFTPTKRGRWQSN